MFSTEDVRELFQAFPPPRSSPTLFLASSGQGFITQDKLRNEFQRRLSQSTGRIPIQDLAHDLDVEPDALLHWIRHGDQRILLSSDSKEVVSQPELDVITQNLRRSLGNSIVSKAEYEMSTHVKFKDLQPILRDIASDLVYHDDYVCTQQYDEEVSRQAKSFVESAIANTTNIDLWQRDLEELQGSPPRWLFLRRLQQHADSAEYKEKVFVRDMPDFIRVQSTDMESHMIKTFSRSLVSGDVAYIDLHATLEPTVSYEDMGPILQNFNDMEGIEVVDNFAISDIWLSRFVDQKVRTLHHLDPEDGMIDVAKGLSARFENSYDVNLKSTYKAHRAFPDELFGHIKLKAEQYLTTAIADTEYRQYGTVLLTKERYVKQQDNLLNRAISDAHQQWGQLKEDPSHELKFTIANITADSAFFTSLAKEKPIQKACDDKFWTVIASLEATADDAFATFWLDKVESKVQIYSAGLTSITDSKLQAQLSDLLATHIQKELVPDSIAKARTQHLVLSRKAKKSISRLESTLSTTTTTTTTDPTLLPTLTGVLSKFRTKQSIPLPSPSSLSQSKQVMQSDMSRRLSKPSTPAPVLFLTLIVALHARYFAGVVYATGKFAPKMMKQLREKVGEEGYGRLEGWKEGAKKGKLGEGEREGMRGMVEEGDEGKELKEGEDGEEKAVDVEEGNPEAEDVKAERSEDVTS